MRRFIKFIEMWNTWRAWHGRVLKSPVLLPFLRFWNPAWCFHNQTSCTCPDNRTTFWCISSGPYTLIKQRILMISFNWLCKLTYAAIRWPHDNRRRRVWFPTRTGCSSRWLSWTASCQYWCGSPWGPVTLALLRPVLTREVPACPVLSWVNWAEELWRPGNINTLTLAFPNGLRSTSRMSEPKCCQDGKSCVVTNLLKMAHV